MTKQEDDDGKEGEDNNEKKPDFEKEEPIEPTLENYKQLQEEIRKLKKDKIKMETQGRRKLNTIKKKVEMASK